jgi:hypothetical protein
MLKNKMLMSVGLLLSFLIVSPQFLMIPQTAQVLAQPTMVSVESHSSVRWLTGNMGSYNVTEQIENYTRIETWTNGTKACFSIHIYNNDFQYSDIGVSCTTWLPNNSTLSVTSLQPLSVGNLPKEILDGNITFIYGSNATCYTTYEHDDNYETYYPSGWNYAFDLQGQTKTHVHLTQKLLDKWVNDEISTAAVAALCVLGFDYVEDKMGAGWIDLDWSKAVVEDALVVLAATLWDVPGANVATVLLILADIIWQIWQYVGKIWWINNVVRELYGGDGWAWRGPLELGYRLLPWDPYVYTAMTIYDWHKVYSYDQTWGTDGVFGTPQSYGMDLGLDHENYSQRAPAGIHWR